MDFIVRRLFGNELAVACEEEIKKHGYAKLNGVGIYKQAGLQC